MKEAKDNAGRRSASARKPDWLRMRRQGGAEYNAVKRLLRENRLHTVCESANCPNRGECFTDRTATFLLLGDRCTRRCTFCNIASGRPRPPVPDEPRRVAEAVATLSLEFAVVTSVTRDDLPDGGAACFAATLRWIRRLRAGCGVEVLIPDFRGDPRALQTVLQARPEVLNHNLETTARLYPALRPQAEYHRSLLLLRRARQWAEAFAPRLRVKTGIMVGAGETRAEVTTLMRDASDCGVSALTIGQYLQPTPSHHPVDRFVTPAEFDELAAIGRELGLDTVESGPLVRSSYHARQQAAARDGAAVSDAAAARHGSATRRGAIANDRTGAT